MSLIITVLFLPCHLLTQVTNVKVGPHIIPHINRPILKMKLLCMIFISCIQLRSDRSARETPNNSLLFNHSGYIYFFFQIKPPELSFLGVNSSANPWLIHPPRTSFNKQCLRRAKSWTRLPSPGGRKGVCGEGGGTGYEASGLPGGAAGTPPGAGPRARARAGGSAAAGTGGPKPALGLPGTNFPASGRPSGLQPAAASARRSPLAAVGSGSPAPTPLGTH